ncbi:MAG TPA: hypothetical protein VGG71_03475 [Chitinophagaceae bacterium]
MSDHLYLILLRLLHIGCGIGWAGSAIYLAFFVEPAVKASGHEGAKFMQQLIRTNRFPIVIMLMAIITVLAGSLLIWKMSAGLQTAWVLSKNGMVLTIGALLAISAFLIGFFISRPASFRMAKIANAIALSGEVPTAAQKEELIVLRDRLGVAGRIIALLLIIAIVGMSIFRYV